MIIMSMEDKSYEVKQILRDSLIKKGIEKKIVKKAEKEDVNILDF